MGSMNYKVFYSEKVAIRQRPVVEIRHQAGDEKSQQPAGQIEGVEKSQQVVDQLGCTSFLADCLRVSILILFLYERQ